MLYSTSIQILFNLLKLSSLQDVLSKVVILNCDLSKTKRQPKRRDKNKYLTNCLANHFMNRVKKTVKQKLTYLCAVIILQCPYTLHDDLTAEMKQALLCLRIAQNLKAILHLDIETSRLEYQWKKVIFHTVKAVNSSCKSKA